MTESRARPTPADVAEAARRRQGFQLPDSALVLRGGTLVLQDLLKALEKCSVQVGRPGLSVYGADVQEPAALLGLVQGQLLHPRVSFTVAGKLRGKGFDLEQTRRPPHYTVWFPEDEDWNFWAREFRSAFDLPRERTDLDHYQVGRD